MKTTAFATLGVSLALVAAVTLLGWQHIINGDALLTFLSMIAAATLGAGAHAIGTVNGSNAAAQGAAAQSVALPDVLDTRSGPDVGPEVAIQVAGLASSLSLLADRVQNLEAPRPVAANAATA